ncbi:hypothetical protein BY996DRAFT_8401822 [Phakopsora pachyrhizi]|nr:hypothetical protein BY996DRAFT_8401822 [Phakopsora pachyrhizi]
MKLRDALKSWEKEFGTAEDRSTEEGVKGATAERDRTAVIGDDEGQVEVGGAEDELLASAAEMEDANGPELAVKINEFLWRAGRLETGELCGVGFEGMRIDGQVDMGLEIWKPRGMSCDGGVDLLGSLVLRLLGSREEDCGMGMTLTRLGFRGEMKLGALNDPGSSWEEAGIAQVSDQIVRRYKNQNKLNQQMAIKGFSQDEEAAGFMKMGNFLTTVFQEAASGAYDSCKSYLKEQSIPSLSKMNYNQKENYCPDDFSSAITYTINDFCNKAHIDNDTVNRTLIGFIPIKKDGDLAFEDFDVEGGEFVIRNLKVFIDLPKVKGITLVVLKTNKLKHQTIPLKSTSGLFTRFVFSCQISKNMSITMKKYHSDHYEDKNHSFGNYDDYIIKG